LNAADITNVEYLGYILHRQGHSIGGVQSMDILRGENFILDPEVARKYLASYGLQD
jgi:hypothetical protein